MFKRNADTIFKITMKIKEMRKPQKDFVNLGNCFLVFFFKLQTNKFYL